jgi:hypothetical protein
LEQAHSRTGTHLPAERADDCTDEYEQLNYAFDKLIRPHIDQDLTKQIYEAAWLSPMTRRLCGIGVPK